jgi:hypothetical protein
LQKFSPDDQIAIICNMLESFDAASTDIEPSDDGPPLDVLRKQVMDASPVLLEVRTYEVLDGSLMLYKPF